MGTPQNYSRDLPERCLRLIDELWPAVEMVTIPSQAHLGPLTTTFLLAMATPVIVLPIERVERHFGRPTGGYVDDRHLDQHMTDEVRCVFKLGRLDRAPFFAAKHWRFANVDYAGENLGCALPDSMAEVLAAPEAFVAAAKMPVSEWASCLRNALSHGGIMYVDREGRQSEGSPAEGFVFVSAKYPDGDAHRTPIRLKLLRIGEVEFRSFVRRWVDWLRASGLSETLAA